MSANLDTRHMVPLLQPVANAFAGTVNTDIMKCAGVGILFTIGKGVGTTGTSTITVDACDDVTPTTDTAVAFMYRASTTPDVWGDWTQATSAGFTTTAGSNQVYEVYVDGSAIGANGYEYARLTAVEVVASAVLGYVNGEVIDPHYAPQPSTVLT